VAVNMGQWNVPGGTVATATFQIPPGPYNITVYNTNTNTLWMGIGTSATVAPNLGTANGLVMHSIPTTWTGYQGSKAGYLYALSTTATATLTAFNYIMVTQET
jgi:hypothetical protein